MRCVVVTGGAGFIGSHLVDQLIALGFKVHVIDNLSTGIQERVNHQATLHIVDIRSEEAKEIISDLKPDALFHLAAQADVQNSVSYPELDMDINVHGTVNILEARRQSHVGKVIFASTSGVYGNLEKDILTESDPTSPISFYGLSKLTAEQYIALYSHFYNISATILRFANVYGPRQTAKGEGGVIAIFMKKLTDQLSLPINGDGEQSRDFVYVQDVAWALIAAMTAGNGHTLHVSTGRRTTINDLTHDLHKLHLKYSNKELQVIHRPAKDGDIKHSCLSNENTQNILHWRPQYSIGQGLEETYLDWMNPS